MAKVELEKAIADLGLVVVAEFVPYSASRSFKQGAKLSERTLNWFVSVKQGDRVLLRTDYSAGIGHAPSYKKVKPGTLRFSLHNEEAFIYETERGKTFIKNSYTQMGGKPILPDTLDVIYSLVTDASVLDHANFESWASDCGYDTDSRNGEAIYHECLKIALALRNGIGEAGLRLLQEASQDY